MAEDKPFGYLARFAAKPGERDALLGILLEATEALRSDPECVLYLLGTREDDPDSVWSSEIWASQAAHDTALRSESARAAIARARPLIVGVEPLASFMMAGGKSG
ncbi:MAG: putative quinol monooxygenase [Clostridia bacterium]